MDDADLFLDDDLGDIANDKLLELEQNAISATQRPPSTSSKQPRTTAQRQRQVHNASSLTRPRASNPPWRPPQQKVSAHPQQPPAVSDPDTPSQQYEFNDESVVNLAEQPLVDWSQSQNLPRRSAVPTHTRTNKQSTVDAETVAAYAAADADLFGRTEGRIASNNASDGVDVAALQARIAALEEEASRARHAESQAQKALESKSGEITIVRANLEKQRKEHDRRMATVQQEYAVQAAKQRAELESGRKEREKMQTDNRFLQHDLNQETERAKRLNVTGKSRTVQSDEQTPRKIRRPGHGDGFDDNEVMFVSPSKSKERSKDSTPKVGSKRKRAAPDSPVPSLSFAKPPSALREESTDSAALPSGPTAVQNAAIVAERKRLSFVQRFLAYCPLGHEQKALEQLMSFALPSTPAETLSSKLMARLSISTSYHEDSMPLQLVRMLLELWRACLDEAYYAPHTLLVDLVCFVIAGQRPTEYNCLTEELVPLCLKALEIVTLPVVRAALNKTFNSPAYKARHAELAQQIDASQVTGLLELMCQACTLSTDRITAFWRTVDFTNSMLLIHKALSMDRVMIGLDLLATSILDTSLGTINADPTLQAKQESDGIYRLTFAFFDIPTARPDEEAYSQAEIAEFRLAVLEVFKRMCQEDYGGRMLAQNAHFLGKLIRFIEEQISRLYATFPSQSQFGSDAEEHDPYDAHDLVATSINTSVRILYHLLTRYNDGLNLGDKLQVVVGGYHKFLIGMTRIAFAEQSNICDYGIAEDVIDSARSILDQWLTPDDGEAIAHAFETPQGTKSIQARKTGNRASQHDRMDTDEPAAA